MAKNRKTPDMNLPVWFDGQNINEALFCEEFLQERRIIFANGAFFTPDGRVTDDLPLRGEIYDKLKFCAVNNIPRKITNILEVLKLEAQVPDFPPEQDRIHLSNGNVGFSSASTLYTVPLRDDVRERAEKTLAKRSAAAPEAGREWGFYIIPDLKTWATNAEQQTPIEHFATFEEAKARFDELRSQPYNGEAKDLNTDGRPYVWGTYGNVLTPALFEYKKQQYPDGVGNYADFIKEHWLGRRTADCIGLIKGYGWLDTKSMTIRYATNGMPDYGADQMYHACKNAGTLNKDYGTVSTMPEIPGLMLWKSGHAGVYIGGGYAIEAMGTSKGVVKTKVSDRNWQGWGKLPYIDYREGN